MKRRVSPHLVMKATGETAALPECDQHSCTPTPGVSHTGAEARKCFRCLTPCLLFPKLGVWAVCNLEAVIRKRFPYLLSVGAVSLPISFPSASGLPVAGFCWTKHSIKADPSLPCSLFTCLFRWEVVLLRPVNKMNQICACPPGSLQE